MNNRKPQSIHHEPDRPSGFEKIVEEASKQLCLSEREARLLALYSNQAEGFRPSLKFVEERTGIPAAKVSFFRRRLAGRGLIGWGGKGLIVNWGVLKEQAEKQRASTAQEQMPA